MLPADVRDSSDAVLVGIGSILTEPGLREATASGKHVYVLGSGVSYGPAPASLESCDVLAVRGPLSAAAIGRPETAATDGAYLVSDAPRLVGPARQRSKTLFIPHFRSLENQPWDRACEEAGLTFVSPESTVAEMFEHLATAQLVVTEAMHGAIVADALRIPWVPVAVSPVVDEFKWRDWLSSVHLEHALLRIPAPELRIRRRYGRVESALRHLQLDGQRRLVAPAPTARELTAWLQRRYGPGVLEELHRAEVGSFADRLTAKIDAWRPAGPAFAETVRALRDAARSRPRLSDDAIFAARLDQLRTAVGTMTATMLAG